MDTPDNKTQPSPSSLVSKFEDSPVFNYISNLSPITPFNSSRSGQSFHVLGFTSPPGLQGSPLTDCPDVLKITSANHVSDVPKNDCSQNVCREVTLDASGAVASATWHNEEVDKSDPTGEIAVRETYESPEVVKKLPEPLDYNSGSPDDSVVHCVSGKPDCEFNRAGTEMSPAKITEGISQEAGCSFENETGALVIPLEENKQECNWEKFINEASDILNCETPAKDEYHEELDDKSIDSGTLPFVATVLRPQNENIDGIQKLESFCSLMSSDNQDVGVPFCQPAVGNSDETSQVPAAEANVLLAEEAVHCSSTEGHVKSLSQQQQVGRRRCLVYEMSGAHYRKLQSDPADTSPKSKPASPDDFNESRPGGNKFSSVLPAIGLHLNALAATSRDKIIVKRRTLTCRRQLISSPSALSSFDGPFSDTRPISAQMSPDTAGVGGEEQKDALQWTGNADQNSISAEGVEFHPSSPKKKRQKSENVGETDSCKRCNCKRSKCLKLYCECFAAGLYCVEPCNCQDCFNKPIHEETVLETRRQIESRNPLAFAPKVIKCSSTPHNGDELNTPASARHKRGCNCKKSGCLKKYCECFQGGVGCSLSCRCDGCKNTFGQKEGVEGIFEENVFHKRATSASSQNEVLATVEENQDHATPEPSINLRARQAVRRPFHFGGTASQFPSTLQSCTTQESDKVDEGSFEEDHNVVPEDEAHTAFNGDYAPPACVTSTSPSSKRVSPPHYDLEPSPGWKSCRKLILKSISSHSQPHPTEKSDSCRENSNDIPIPAHEHKGAYN